MKAMILAAGLGERFRPHTERVPKPLIQVQGRPLIEHHLLALAKAGVTEVILNVCHLADHIQDTLGDGSRYGIAIHYSDESTTGVLGTYMGVHHALNMIGKDPFLLLSADIFTDYDFSPCVSLNPSMAHVVLVPNPDWHPDGDFGCANERLCLRPSDYTYANIGVYHPNFFATPHPVEYGLGAALHDCMKLHDIGATVYQGNWHNVGTVAQWRAVASPSDQLP